MKGTNPRPQRRSGFYKSKFYIGCKIFRDSNFLGNSGEFAHVEAIVAAANSCPAGCELSSPAPQASIPRARALHERGRARAPPLTGASSTIDTRRFRPQPFAEVPRAPYR